MSLREQGHGDTATQGAGRVVLKLHLGRRGRAVYKQRKGTAGDHDRQERERQAHSLLPRALGELGPMMLWS